MKYLILAVLLLICIAPVLAVLSYSLVGDSGFDLSAYKGILSEERQLTLLTRTVYIALIATFFALLMGIPVGYTAARAGRLLGPVIESVSMVPLLLPSIIICMGWIYLVGQNGLLNNLCKELFGVTKGPFNIYNPTGVSFVLALSYFPCVSILSAQAFRSIQPQAVRASLLVTSPSKTFRGVVLPMASPFILSGALLVFLLSISDFGIPSALMVNVYSVEIFTQFSAYYDVKKAIAFCVPPFLFVVVVYILRHVFFRALPAESKGYAGRGEYNAKISMLAVLLSLFVLFLSVLIPLCSLLTTAKTFQKFAESLRTAGDQLTASISVSLMSTIFMVGFAVLCSAFLKNSSARLRHLFSITFLLLLVIPGAAVGMGILLLYENNIWPVSAFYGTPLIVAYASLCRYIIFPFLVISSVIFSLKRRLGDAAVLSGSSAFDVFKTITLPLALPGIIAGAILSFVFSLGELSAAVLVCPPGYTTLAVRIESLLHFGEDAIVAALCLILSAVVIAIVALGALILNRMVRIKLT